MITPEITECTTYDYKIIDDNGTIQQTGALLPLEGDVYYFNLTISRGEYVVRLCDGATREIIVEESENERYYLYVAALLVFAILLGIGYWREMEAPIILSGMLSIMVAWNIFVNGFPNLDDGILKTGVISVLAGIGMLFILLPSIEWLENFTGGLTGRLE